MSEIITNNPEAQAVTPDMAAAEVPVYPGAEQATGTALEDVLAQTEPVEEPEKAETGKKEPGYVKKRIDEAIAKERTNILKEAKAEYERMLAPLREAQIGRDADDLVKQGEFKSRERAIEYLRLKQGVSPVQQTQEAQREEAPAKPLVDPKVQQKAAEINAQAKMVQRLTGIDVLAGFRAADKATQTKIATGEMDFTEFAYAYAEQHGATQAVQQRAAPPSPIRTANSATPQNKTFAQMNDDELARVDNYLKKGGRVG